MHLYVCFLDACDFDDWPDNDSLLLIPAFGEVDEISEITSANEALKLFRKNNIDENQPVQQVFVSRLEGPDQLKKDVIGVYKNPSTNLRVGLKICFEEEDAVGSGPVREFLTIAVNILDEGISSSGSKKLLFFEGQTDHRIPVHNQSLRVTGTYKALGKMLGHSILHGGPGLHGLSPAAKCYLSSDRNTAEMQSLPLSLEDVPDLELRRMIVEVNCNVL